MIIGWRLIRSRAGCTAALLVAAGLIFAAGSKAHAAGLLVADGGWGGVLDIDEHTARVTINEKINKNLSFTYSQNVISGPTGLDQIVLVEYYLSNRLSVIGIRDETLGSTGFNIRIRKRF